MTRTQAPVLPPLYASEVTHLKGLPHWLLTDPVVPEGAGVELLEYTSELGRVVAVSVSDETYLLEQDVDWNEDDSPVPTSTRVYQTTTSDVSKIENDCKRLFVSQGVRNGLAVEYAGWRDRLVVLIAEADTVEEPTIYSVRADGTVTETFVRNPLSAYQTYAQQVEELAAEFQSTRRWTTHVIDQSAPYDGNLVHAWLVREASQALLKQAQQSLKARLATEAERLQQERGAAKASVSELARSLHTDRPNLSRMMKTAEIEYRDYQLRSARG